MDEIPLMRELLYEAGRALPWVRLFRRNILRLKMTDNRGKERMVIAGIPGQGDLYGYIFGGRVIEIEIKSKNGRLSSEQRTWRDWCQAGQIPWLCLWPWPGESREETVARWVSVIAMVAGSANGTLSNPVAVESATRLAAQPKRPRAKRGRTR